MKKAWDEFIDWLNKYPTITHIALAVWNGFIVSWATKVSVPLYEFGIPISINASEIVSWLQLHAHVPTSLVAVLTFLLNGFAYYINWKKNHASVKQTVNVIDTPNATITDKIVETKDVQQK